MKRYLFWVSMMLLITRVTTAGSGSCLAKSPGNSSACGQACHDACYHTPCSDGTWAGIWKNDVCTCNYNAHQPGCGTKDNSSIGVAAE